MCSRSKIFVKVPALQGFTLLELLVVILVMGLSVGLVSVIVQPDERALLDVEARRLGALLALAEVEARYGGSAFAWVAQPDSYIFERQEAAGAWEPVRDNDALRARELPAGIVVTAVRSEAGDLLEVPRLELSPFGLSGAFAIELSYGAASTRILMSPLGKVSVEPTVPELP